MQYDSLRKLAASGQISRLESEWMAAIESPEVEFAALVPVLETLAQKGEADAAELLAWSALTEARQRLTPRQAVSLASAMLLAVEKAEQLRGEVRELFEQVYADVPHLRLLIERSGLADGSKSARRALRMLEVCLAAEPGGYLLSRRDDTVAVVVSADPATDCYEVRFRQVQKSYGGDELSTEFGPVDEDDFRVLNQHRHERLTALLEERPEAVVVSALRARGGRMSQDDLRFLLTPGHLPPEAWTKWWSKARTGLKRDRRVRLEGRSPVTLVYEESGTDLESLAWAGLRAAHTPSRILQACESYFRECRAVRQPPKPEFVRRLLDEVAGRIPDLRRDHPAAGWAAALVADWLADEHAADAGPSRQAAEYLHTVERPAELLLALEESKLWPRAVETLRAALGEGAAEEFAAIFPRAPEGVCELLADVLLAAGQAERLAARVADICVNPTDSIEALAWLWKSPKAAETLPLPPLIELLSRMLDALSQVNREPDTPAARRGRVRQAVRGALSHAKYRRFDECLAQIDEAMASTIRNQIGRLEGLGAAVPEDLLELIRKRFPSLWARPKLAPWEDESVIYVTAAGLHRREKEIDHLVNVEMAENARAIGEAASHGDLSENSEYRFALERRDMLRSRLAVMQAQMLKARVIDAHDVPTDHVGVGSRIRLLREDDGSAVELTLLGPWDADPARGVYNYQAPMCRHVLGRRVGDTVHLTLDSDENPYRIEAILPGF